MSIQRASRFLPMAAIASLLTIMLLGGCPVAQQPTTPTDEQGQLEPPAAPGADGDLDRPIPPPDLDGDDDQDDSDGDDTAGDGGGAGDDDGGGGASSASVTLDEPAGDLAVRPGTPVNVEFAIYDSQGALVSVEFVLVRDDDADYQPDGSPVLAETLSFQAGNNTYSFDTTKTVSLLLNNGFARLLVGIRYKTVDGQTKFAYASGSLRIDCQEPTGQWIAPTQDLLLSCSTQLDISLSTTDNRPVTVKVLLDPDQTPVNGNEWTLISNTELPAGTNVPLNSTVNLQAFPAGNYYYYVTVSDGIEPPFSFYAQTQGTLRRLGLTDRLIGDFALDQLTNSDKGAILQGFNFNDLAGSSMATVPDLNGDGNDELIIVSRFGKPYFIETDGVGFGEAYMIYGESGRLSGIQKLNAVGKPGNISGLVFPGIRNPLNQKWTEGLSDVTVIDDMDGDDLAEIVFSFPRVESVSLQEQDPTIQHPELVPDIGGMGAYEYNAFYGMIPAWHPDEAQFTRGGIVIVSSHNELLTDPEMVSRKFDRVLDLHEVGQMFNFMNRASLRPYIRQVIVPPLADWGNYGYDPNDGCQDCDPEATGECRDNLDPNNPYEEECTLVVRIWDVWLGGG